ncbi:MAG: OPT family oligopeptide transporter [Planctomycetota bacterium]
MEQKPFVPYVPAERSIPEVTVIAVLIGLLIGVVMTAANVYFGLFAGMTISASIPAAVISMGILKGILRRGTILENNIVQTVASAGESIAAGIIFTIPGIVIAGAWADFGEFSGWSFLADGRYWTITLIAMTGGILGILFMVPLRRALIVEEQELRYPEGLACAEVLETGDRGGSGVVYVFAALGVGFLFKFMEKGLAWFGEAVEGAWRVGKTAVYAGSNLSVALPAVGFIVGLNVAVLIFLGGFIGWAIGIPIYGLINGAGEEEALDFAWGTWSGQIRYMGVGAMIVGGIWSIIGVRRGILRGIERIIASFMHISEESGSEQAEIRTERDMKGGHVMLLLGITLLGVLFLYQRLIGSVGTGVLMTVLMGIGAFFFVAVSSYVVGLVGSSNNPVSGMTICTMLFTSAVLLFFGLTEQMGVIASLGVAGVVCCAACTAGDVSQDLKTGYLVGATPRRQQWVEILGVIVPAFFIAPVLALLHSEYGIGIPTSEGVTPLAAPQASLFASIARAMFQDESLPWTMIEIGMGIGVALIIADEILRRSRLGFRTYVMPVAVGIYLPFGLSVPILAGGLLGEALKRSLAAGGNEGEVTDGVRRGVLFSSGLIAGEAIAGILVAVLSVSSLIDLKDAERGLEGATASSIGLGSLLGALLLLCWSVLGPRRR